MIPYINIHTHSQENVVIVAGSSVLLCRGVHPWDAAHVSEFSVEGVAAIGEVGLDYACDVDRGLQQKVFRSQLALAERAGLPVVLHSVRAMDDTLKIIADFTLPAVIFHGFVGSAQTSERILKAGAYISFGHRAFGSPKTIESLRGIPAERIFLETDTAEMPIEEIYARAAEIRATDVMTLKEQIYSNYKNIFE